MSRGPLPLTRRANRDGNAARGSGSWSGELPLVGYSLGNFGKNLLLSGIDLTLLFMLTDLLGVDPGRIGPLMVIVLVGDVAFDIASGWLANRAARRGLGYRRIIALGIVPCAMAFALIYSLPLLHVRSLVIIGAALLAFRATYAIIDVPHNSLLSRITTDSRARGRTSGYRSLFSSLASLLVALMLTPSVVAAAREATASTMAVIGIVCGAMACVTLWLAAWSARTGVPAAPRQAGPARIALIPRVDGLILAMAMIGISTGLTAPMFGRMTIYLATYVYREPELAGRILFAMTLGQMPGFVLWTYLVRHFDKTALLAVSNVLAVASLGLFAIVGGDRTLVEGLALLTGASLSGVFMLPWAILADVIDFSQFRHTERREAATVAAFLVLIKTGGIAATTIIGMVLSHVGYAAGTIQTATTLLAMKWLAFGVPITGSLLVLVVLGQMACGHEKHARIARILARRSRAKPPSEDRSRSTSPEPDAALQVRDSSIPAGR